MILKPQDLRKVRPIAENINDPARVEPYIREAETLRLVDLIGATLYKWLDEVDETGDGPFTYTKDDGGQVVLSKDQLSILLNGGYYVDKCGKGQRTEGIRTGIAYVAYSRFLINNPVNPTAFGVRIKNGEFSTEVDDTILTRTSAEARKIGEAYISKAMAFIRDLGLLPSCKPTTPSPARNLIIRDVKM